MLILLIIGQVYWLDEIVVTATRYPEELIRVPVSVSVIDKDEIANYRDLSDAISGVAGLKPLNYGLGSLTTIGIRGLPADETLVLIDGLPINSVATGVGDVSFIPTEMVERVEIVKGPTSSIFGSNAVGGVINIVTRRDGFVKTGIGDHGYWGLHSSGSIGHVFHLGGGGTHWNGDRTNDEMSRYLLSGDLQLGRFKIGGLFSEKQFGVPGPVPGSFIPEFGDSTASSIFDQETDHRVTPYIELTLKPSEVITLSNVVYLNYYKVYYETYYRYYVDLQNNFPALEQDDYQMATVGNESQVRFSLPFENRIAVGLSYNYDTLHVSSVVDNDSTKARYSDEIWQEGNHRFGLWLEDRQTISFLDLYGAVRFDRDKRFKPAFTPALGLSCLLTDRIRLRTHWGMAYRIPTFNDLYWPNSGNSDLEPEKGTGVEGGVDLFIPYGLTFSISGFERKIKDKIAWVPTGSLWQPENINQVESRGIDLAFGGRPIDLCDFSINYTYLEPKQINSEPILYNPQTNSYTFKERERTLINTPRHSGRASITLHLEPLRVGLATIYTGRRFSYFADYSRFPQITYNEKEIGSSFLTNLSLGVNLSTFTIKLGIDNITDRTDPTQFGNSIDDRDYPRTGRSLRFEVGQAL